MKKHDDMPPTARDFLIYMENIRGKSQKTVDEYALDLRLFFRFMKQSRGLAAADIEFDDIDIRDVDAAFLKSVKLADFYDYLNYLSRERQGPMYKKRDTHYGLNAASRARKISALRSYFKYLTNRANVLDINPAEHLETPKQAKKLPVHLDIAESVKLLDGVDGLNRDRDYCILTILLNCGLRVSELVGINMADLREDSVIVTGKGNKQRVIYLNQACLDALNIWLPQRSQYTGSKKQQALFLSRKDNRISTSTVKWLVKKHLLAAGLDTSRYSTHKLRHTAATLMYQNGVDVRVLQEVLGHESLNTTKIYTHVDNNQVRNAINANPLATVKAPGGQAPGRQTPGGRRKKAAE